MIVNEISLVIQNIKIEFQLYVYKRIFLLNSRSFLSLVKNCNHKGLGIYYLLSAFIFGISGTLISVLIRIELYSSGNRIISPENQNFYNITITLHGFLMIFFFIFFFVMPEKPLLFKRHKVVRFLISPKKKKVKIEVNKIMNPANMAVVSLLKV